MALVTFEASFSVREFRNDDAVTVSSGQNNTGTLTDNFQESKQGRGEILVKCVFSEILSDICLLANSEICSQAQRGGIAGQWALLEKCHWLLIKR